MEKLNEFIKNPNKSPLPISHFNVARGLIHFGFDIPFNLQDI